MGVEPTADELAEYAKWTPLDEDLADVTPEVRDFIHRFRLDCCHTDRNRIPYYGEVDDVVEYRDIPYVDDGTRAHLLDIYIPKDAIITAAHNLPVYMDVHGGGFVYGYKDLNRNFCIALARRGFAVVSISYRVFPQADFLGQLQDVNAAYQWLVAHADEYPIDANRIGITGDSAGGCLSLFTLAIQRNPGLIDRAKHGFQPTDFRFGFLVSGKYDLTTYTDEAVAAESAEPDMLQLVADDLFGGFLREADRDTVLSLRRLAAGLPPLFLTTSSDDFIQYETLGLADALARENSDFDLHDLRPSKGQALGHIFPVGMPWLSESSTVLDKVRDFTYEVM